MAFFLKKKPPASPAFVPIDLVQRMAAAGMPEPIIAAQLRARGFSPPQIETALREALKVEVGRPSGEGPIGPPAEERPPEMPPVPPVELPPVARPPAYPAPVAAPVPRQLGIPPERVTTPLPPQAQTVMTFERPAVERLREAPAEITLEEVVEGIVADRWSEFEDRLSDFEKRDIQLQAQIQDLKKSINELESRLKAKESDMVTHLEGMTESMTGIEGRIGSIEKVFKDFIPQITESARTMADIVEKLKAKK